MFKMIKDFIGKHHKGVGITLGILGLIVNFAGDTLKEVDLDMKIDEKVKEHMKGH